MGIVWIKTKIAPVPSQITFRYLDTSVEKNKSLVACDPELYRILKPLVDREMRTIANLQTSHALPANTVYFDKLFDFRDIPLDDRFRFRQDWFRGALNVLQDTDMVFFDPDTGMEIPSMKRHRNGGTKYVWYDELKPFFERGQSLVVYQHGDHGAVEQAIKRRGRELRDALKCKRIWVARWHRVQSRFYFIIPADEHIARIEQAISWLHASPWCLGEHFSVSEV
ncbi:MAG: hypothetical protein O2783_00850 [Chloroflexi bacterium]|nr:hypothetical protein [Chloroflexota bacterium]